MALAATAAALSPVAGTGTAAAESNGGVRVMPLGDSITEGTQVPGGYRIGLWQRLAAGRYTIDFVGSQYNGPAGLGDHDHEGHPGWRIDQIDANVTGWLRTHTPRTVLLHIGTNDVLQNYNVSSAPSRLSALIDHITAAAPNAEVFVATIIPLSNSGQEAAARTFNAAIPGIVRSKVNSGRRVHLVDMHGRLTTADLIDGVHPTATGYDKMAAAWYQALQSVPGSIGQDPGPSPSPSVTPSPSATPTPSGEPGACRVGVTVNAWNTGLTDNLVITNTGSSPINGWSLAFTLPGGQTVTGGWNATYTPAGGRITARNVTYNASLAPGASTEIGFQATHTGDTGKPTAFTLNGAACTLS
ncbi:lysophospholipase L1-like esterase [Streptosporangium sandarakinum]|uniref:Lysophospholipase L1-like esterase n=2 Tax=Streptosporangium TaxID=2000 RepID=A0A852UQK4_9ACTN|nr:cellulose binding domain-containing protein [Streptosporangium sandarakinum]NYF38489.1 lysophospholipase L1-like esterase [Streptosporangium sandarakinum]